MTISDRRGADKPEILFQERIAELEKTNQALRTEILECKSSENELIKLKAEIRDANALHTLSTRYIEGIDSHSLYQEIVDAAIAITKADKGNIQLLDQSIGKFKIVAYRGFDFPFLKFFEFVSAGEAAACGTAMKRMERVVIEDITQSPIFIGSDALEVLLNEGVLGVQSTPLVSRSGKLLGIISTHFSQIRTLSEHELMLIDILAQQAADIIEHEQTRHTHRYNRILEGINKIFGIVVQEKTEEDLGNECLSVALGVTGSQIGFVSLVGDDGLLHDIAISEMGWEQCLMYDKTGHRRPPRNFVVHGLYGNVINSEKSLFTNDPQSHVDGIGLSHGHPLLTSFLGVPLILDKKIMGMLGVANREGGYNCEQQEDLEAITPAIVQALNRKKVEFKRKQAKKALKESEQRLQAIIDGSDNAFYVKDLNGHFILINKHLEKLLGMKREEVIGKTDYDLFTPELADCYKMHDSKILETGVPEQLEEVSYLVDGWHTFLANKFPLYDLHGKSYAICGISTDITERKQTQLRLKADLDALTRMHELSGKLLGTGGIQPLLDEIMYSAVVITGAQRGTLQLLEDDSLRIVSQYGHKQPFREFFASAENRASACGEAMQRGGRVIVEDIETSSLFAGTPSLDVMRKGRGASGAIHANGQPHWRAAWYSHDSMGRAVFPRRARSLADRPAGTAGT